MIAMPLASLLLLVMDPASQVTQVSPAPADTPANIDPSSRSLARTASESAAAPPVGGVPPTPACPIAVPLPPEATTAGFGLSTGQVPVSATADVPQAEIVVTGDRHIPSDPLRGANAVSFEATQAVDKAVIGPVATAYKRALPSPVRSGVRNFLANLREPTVAIAYLLQLKPGKSAETLGRLAINSTIGVAGLFDIAKRRPFNLPRRRNGFADTLGYYGVKPGAFLFLPLIGPTTVRDLFGDTLDQLFLPTAIGRPFSRRAFALPATLLRSLDYRAEFDEQLHAMRDDNPDAYATLRNHYLHRRQAEIDGLRGRGTSAPASDTTVKTPPPPDKTPNPVALPDPACDPVASSDPSAIAPATPNP